MAFSTPAASPVVFDLSVKAFGKKPQPAEQVVLRPPGPADEFAVLPHRLSSVVTAAARTWAAGPDTRRGLLVLRARTANDARRALVLRLRGRDPSAPEAPAELPPGFDRAALVPPAPARTASVRLLGFTRVRPGGGNEASVSTLVRFDPARPAEPADEQLADRLNEALRGKRQDRVAAFGTDRPFRVEWEVLPNDVVVATARGPATSSVVVTNRETRAALSARERPVYLGLLNLALPGDGIVTGEGRVLYQGRDVGLAKPEVRVVFSLPSPTYASEWDLVSDVLQELDQAAAPGRLEALRRDACAPGAAAECDERARRGLGRPVPARPRDALRDAAGARERRPALRPVRAAVLEDAALGRRGGGSGAREAAVAAGDGGGRRQPMKPPSLRRCVVLAGLTVLGAAGGLDGQGAVRLAPDSPLASDGVVLYAVAEDGRTLVSQPLSGSAAWTAVPLTPAPQSIGGLASAGGALYIADTAAAALLRVDVARGVPAGPARVLHQGPPLRRPRELALARLLLVADEETREVYGLPPGGGTPARIQGLPPLPPGPVYLAGSEDPSEGHVVLSLGGPSPAVIEARLAGTEAIVVRPLLEVRPGAAGGGPERPGPVALRSGIVYVADQANGALWAFPRERGQGVRIVRSGPGGEHAGRTAHVMVTRNDLVELDPDSGSVVKRPRLVPAELVLQTESLSETLALWYAYLHGNGILPTREVPLSRNVEATLRAHDALLAPYVRSLDPLMCALNRAHCTNRVLRPLQDGEPLRIPDLPFERFADVREVALDGKQTLGQLVDALVPSDALASWRSEEALRKLNPENANAWYAQQAQKAPDALRERRAGQFVVPVEAVRCLAAVRAVDLPPSPSELGRIAGFRGASIRSLEEVRARRSSAAQPPPTAPGREDLQVAHDAVTAGWSEDLWLPRPVLVRPHVGVVEEVINRDNPVFSSDGDDAFALDREGSPGPPAASAAVPAGLVVRPADAADHGTGVAWLIGGRGSRFGRRGLAPAALLFHVPDNLGGLRRALADAVAQHNVHVFNISAYWRDVPVDKLSAAINTFAETALFVVAAGNNATTGSDGQVCEAFTAFPVCWGDRRNVLVVTATNRDRTALLPPLVEGGVVREMGANWNAQLVHVAAPGEGYYVPGANGDYVPARGSSFATPLVTATAALLYAQGVQRPSLIKQRILATADPVAGLSGFVKAGVLNLRRALGDPFLSVVTTPDGEQRRVVVVPGQQIEVVTSDGRRRPLPLDTVMRLHKYGTSGLWRIVYTPLEAPERLEVEEDVDFADEAHSTFRYLALREVVGSGAQPSRYWVSQADRALEGKLVDYVDFVGPAIPPGR